jgi:hypothetical protein
LSFVIDNTQKKETKNELLNHKTVRRFARKHTGKNDFYSYLATKRNLHDSIVFNLHSFKYNKSTTTIKLNFGIGAYRNYINLNEAIVSETKFSTFLKNYSSEQEVLKIRKFFLNHLLKSSLHQIRKLIPFSNILDYEKHPCSIGLNVFTVFKAENRYYTIFQNRNPNLVENPGFKHVLPAGTYQPFSLQVGYRREDYHHGDFSHTVFRELAEELFDVEQLQNANEPDAVLMDELVIEKKLLTDQSVAVRATIGELFNIRINDNFEIEKLDQKGALRLIPTAFYIDLLSLKPQVSLFLYFESDKLLDFMAKVPLSNRIEGNANYVEVDSDEFYNIIKDHLFTGNFTHTGIIPFIEGYSYFKKMSNSGLTR